MSDNFNQISCILNTTINDLLCFIISNKNYKEEIVELGKDYNIESNINFNIFTSFSDYYYRENLHSDILKFIFDPHTEKIGNNKYIEIFIRFIEKKLNKKIEFDLNTIKIEREKDRIDILITDDSNNCVFIENKINNAGDRDNQIGRYYTILFDKKYSIHAVIYLTLSPLKRLDKNYSIKDPKIRKKIENILLEIPVVNKKNEDNFVDNVINKCIGVSNNIVSTVYLTEYSSLLKYLGGNFMAKDLDTQALYKIFSNKDAVDSFRVFGSLWDKRHEIIGNVFMNYFCDELKFSEHPGDTTVAYKPIKEDINIGFYSTWLSFGFVHTPSKPDEPNGKISEQNGEIFKELLENTKLQKYFTTDEVINNGWLVCKPVDHNKIKCLDDLKIMVDELEKLL